MHNHLQYVVCNIYVYFLNMLYVNFIRIRFRNFATYQNFAGCDFSLEKYKNIYFFII